MIRTIKVTQEEIRAGVQGKSQECPTALAIKKLVKSDVFVSIANVVIFARPSLMLQTTVLTPLGVLDKIEEYDRGMGMEPFEFPLDIPVWALEESAVERVEEELVFA